MAFSFPRTAQSAQQRGSRSPPTWPAPSAARLAAQAPRHHVPLAAPAGAAAPLAGGVASLATSPLLAEDQWSSPELATYPLQLRQRAPQPPSCWSSGAWFEAMVQTVVRQLDGRPFLLRVEAGGGFAPPRLRLVRLSDAELARGWPHIQAAHLEPAGDAAVILVHPVASEAQPCVVSRVRGASCPGCPLPEEPAAGVGGSSSRGSSSWDGARSPSPEVLHGRLGHCCSGDGHGHAPHEGHPQAAQAEQQQQLGSRAAASAPDSGVAFYGLVVQPREASDPAQGCYLLKTMQVAPAAAGAGGADAAGGCCCTHYALSRVCQGPPLQQQWQDAWLA